MNMCAITCLSECGVTLLLFNMCMPVSARFLGHHCFAFETTEAVTSNFSPKMSPFNADITGVLTKSVESRPSECDFFI